MALVTTGGLIDNPPSSTILAPAQWAISVGTTDVITGAYTTPNTSLPDGLLLGFRAGAANITTTPTFSPDGLPAAVITRWGGDALQPGDIPGVNAETLVRYNLFHTRWELLNPAQALNLAVTAGGSADVLTVTLGDFSLVDDVEVKFRAANTNATGAPSLNVNGTGAIQIVRSASFVPVIPGEIQASGEYTVRYNLSIGRWVLVNAAVLPQTPWGVAGGTAQAQTLTIPGVTSLFDGLTIGARITTVNSGSGPTLAVNGGTAYTIVKRAATALAAGDLAAGAEYLFRYNLANTNWVVLNPVVN